MGVVEAQAAVVVATTGTAITGNVATKQDITDLRSETQVIQAYGATKQDIYELRSGMQAMGLRMVGLISAGASLTIALDKLL